MSGLGGEEVMTEKSTHIVRHDQSGWYGGARLDAAPDLRAQCRRLARDRGRERA